jgi:hypothetical protein
LHDDGSANRRWCAECSKQHVEAIDFSPKCEDCKQAAPIYGTINTDGSRTRRWCAKCRATHANAINLAPKCMVDDCDLQTQQDGYCTTHHPAHIPSIPGASKIACSFIDMLSSQFRVPIRHRHYNHVSKQIAGSEFVIPGTRRRADGHFEPQEETKLPFAMGKGVIVEFLGHAWHGYPNNLRKDESNHVGRNYGELFIETMQRIESVHKMGYTVVYIWESDFLAWKKQVVRSLLSYCQVLD